MYCLFRTSRDHSFNSCAVDKSSLDGLGTNIGPVDTVLLGIVVYHGYVVNVRHSERNNVVVVWVVDVHSSDLDLASVQQELTRFCKEKSTCVL